ncbi:ABC transporter ATP-binding protein [Nannocystaceae bacterium ST9]
MFAAFVFLIIASGIGLLHPYYFGAIIDSAFGAQDAELLGRITLTLIGLFAVQALFSFLRHSQVAWIGERVVADLRVAVYSRLLSLSPGFFHRRRTGELMSRVTDDVARLHRAVSGDLSLAARHSLALLGGVAILIHRNPSLTAMMLALVPPLIVVTNLCGRAIRRLARAGQDALAEANAEMQQGIVGIETVQAFTRESYELGRYSEALARGLALARRRIAAGGWFLSLSSFASLTAVAVIFYMGGRMVIAGRISPGELTEFMLYTMLVAGAVEGLAGLWTNLQAASGATTRIFELLDARAEIRDSPNPRQLGSIRGAVKFESVDFRYPGRGERVLDGIDLDIPAGRTCALVGTSGAGKSTLARLLLRLHDPCAGRVTIDGVDLRSLRVAELRGRMAVVTQEPMLFAGSIRENIRYGRLDASEDEVEAAARAAHVEQFAAQLESGYDTSIGERGVQLSGGQRQRVAIARAILRDPEILVLDEATSALDAESEAIVQSALVALQRGRTTLVIAHRLSTIRDADLIVVLERGRIVERGTHADLLARGGAFSKLIARQTLVD